MLRIHRRYRHLKRYRQIAMVLIKYGFADLAERLDLAAYLHLGRRLSRVRRGVEGVTTASRIRMALEELGPTFVKLGQVLSTRSVLVPADLLAELVLLQDRVRPEPFSVLEHTLNQELQGAASSRFASIESAPLASASIAQVHRARTVDGQEVVVKIQRPRIAELIEVDMEILLDLARLIERHLPEGHQFDPVGLVEELARSTRRELDFFSEARNVELFARNCATLPGVRVPAVFWELTTSRVLTLEYVEGVKISDVESLRALGIDLKALVRRGADFVLKQIFEDGFFHADPHPGNLLVRSDGTIAPVDFGIMGRLDDQMLALFADLLVGVTGRDVSLILRVMAQMGIVPQGGDEWLLRLDIGEFIDRYYGANLGKLRMKAVLDDAVAVLARHRLRVPSNLMLLGKTLGSYEDIAEKLDPEFSFAAAIGAYAGKLMWRQFEPERVAYQLERGLRDLYRLAVTLPHEMEVLLRRLSAGKIGAELRHQGLENLIREVDRSSNRLSFSLIIAALIVASSMIIAAHVGPSLLGVSVLGIVGYAFAGLLGVRLVVAILRSGRL
ncbi:MAG: AarF/UbiB family protein [bacterium]|nr:AarF/UbiB family protein [candidate division KSB1 bacterium]MDH7559688.1 AarF/UbiB family protein [bacterium]